MSTPQRSGMSRRHFIQTAAAFSGLALGAHAAEPIVRNGKPHMKLSLAAYSFNRVLAKRPETAEPGRMDMHAFIDFCAEQDLDGTELTSYYFPAKVDTAYLNSLAHRAFELGLDVSGTAIGNDFCLAPGEARDADLAMTREWIDYAAILGAPVIRIFAGKVSAGDTEEVALERCVEGINESLKYAAEKGVYLALENHGGITARPEQLLNIVKAVEPSPWFGINFDSGNFQTEDPYAALEMIAPYAVNAQIKVSIKPNGKKERSDFSRVIGILRDANYRGYVVLEYEEPEDPFENIPPLLRELRELISL
ncbi:MAG: TIM barrel protein [Candidatus Hydrogenedens sp.]|nr:TIM barrel protein [Candidatus Hydrogenedens sp.]